MEKYLTAAKQRCQSVLRLHSLHCQEVQCAGTTRPVLRMLPVTTHLDDVIDVNNSRPFTLQSSTTGRVDGRGCRCECGRIPLQPGLVTPPARRKQAIKPRRQSGVRLASLLTPKPPPPRTGSMEKNIRGRDRKKDLVDQTPTITTTSQRTSTTVKYMETYLWLWFDLRGRGAFTASLIPTEPIGFSLDVSVFAACLSLVHRREVVKLSSG